MFLSPNIDFPADPLIDPSVVGCQGDAEDGAGAASGDAAGEAAQVRRGVRGQRTEGAKNIVNLVNLDIERCPKIHGGLVHLKDILLPLSLSFVNYEQIP